MKFKKLKKRLEQTRGVQICLTSTGGDIAGTFNYPDEIPDKYDNFSVLGVGIAHIDSEISESAKLVPALEIYLDDIKSRKKEISKEIKKKEKKKNEFNA